MSEVSVDLETKRAIEAIVLAATEPVEPGMLAQLLEIPAATVEEVCAALADEYEREGRGFVMVRVAGGYRFQTHPDAVQYVERFVLDGRHARLSGAALETLAIIAYKQPISRAQISAIRGVNVDATLRTLVQRGYVDEVGHDSGPGQPALFGTTPLFLERLGLDSLGELPPLADFVPEPAVVEALERGLHLAPPEAGGVEGEAGEPEGGAEDRTTGAEAPEAAEVVEIAEEVAASADEAPDASGPDAATQLAAVVEATVVEKVDLDVLDDLEASLADELRAGLDDTDDTDERAGA